MEEEQGEDSEVLDAMDGWDSEEEARSIGDEIEALQNSGHILNEIAILVRASFQMREFEDRFVTMGLNYRVIGGPRFYERMEIRDAMAYFRVVCQPADDLAFERIVNKPKRGIGDATIRTIRAGGHTLESRWMANYYNGSLALSIREVDQHCEKLQTCPLPHEAYYI